MSERSVYVDIDDVLAETIESLIDLLDAMHGRRVAVDDVAYFDLERSFDLDEEEIADLMDRAHEDDLIESIRPVAGAAQVLDDWTKAGFRIELVTGRPPSTNAASRRWLTQHGIAHAGLHHLDKWSRPSWNPDALPALGFEELPNFDFDFAVEDSLDTAVRLVDEFGIPVALMDRPWNRDLSSVSPGIREKLSRCENWNSVTAWVENNR